jgi:hypothetical protein
MLMGGYSDRALLLCMHACTSFPEYEMDKPETCDKELNLEVRSIIMCMKRSLS